MSPAEELIIAKLGNTPGFNRIDVSIDSAREAVVVSRRTVTKGDEGEEFDHPTCHSTIDQPSNEKETNGVDDWLREERSMELPHDSYPTVACSPSADFPADSINMAPLVPTGTGKRNKGASSAGPPAKKSKKPDDGQTGTDGLRSLKKLQRSVLTLEKRKLKAELGLIASKKKHLAEKERVIAEFAATMKDFRRAVAEYRLSLRGVSISEIPVEVPEGLIDGALNL